MGFFDFLKSTQKPILSDATKLFIVAKNGIIELKNVSHSLTDEGRLEVIIFNSTVALSIYSKTHPQNLEKVKAEVLQLIFNQAKTYQIQIENSLLIEFILSRMNFYTDELLEIMIDQITWQEKSEETGYTPYKIYNIFYLYPLRVIPEPLSLEDEDWSNVSEIKLSHFYACLCMDLMKWITEQCRHI